MHDRLKAHYARHYVLRAQCHFRPFKRHGSLLLNRRMAIFYMALSTTHNNGTPILPHRKSKKYHNDGTAAIPQ